MNKLNLKRLDASDVRKTAYWNMFAGAAGHTYGCNEIWQMFDHGRVAKFGAYLPWKEALHLPGSLQMGLMKKLFTSLPWQNLRNNQDILFPSFLANYRSVLAMVSLQKDMILVYSPHGRSFILRLGTLRPEKVNAYWYDPVDGSVQEAGQYSTHQTARFSPLKNRKGKDTVLVILESEQSIKWKVLITS